MWSCPPPAHLRRGSRSQSRCSRVGWEKANTVNCVSESLPIFQVALNHTKCVGHVCALVLNIRELHFCLNVKAPTSLFGVQKKTESIICFHGILLILPVLSAIYLKRISHAHSIQNTHCRTIYATCATTLPSYIHRSVKYEGKILVLEGFNIHIPATTLCVCTPSSKN